MRRLADEQQEGRPEEEPGILLFVCPVPVENSPRGGGCDLTRAPPYFACLPAAAIWEWLYWISYEQWIWSALMINEFKGAEYDALCRETGANSTLEAASTLLPRDMRAQANALGVFLRGAPPWFPSLRNQKAAQLAASSSASAWSELATSPQQVLIQAGASVSLLIPLFLSRRLRVRPDPRRRRPGRLLPRRRPHQVAGGGVRGGDVPGAGGVLLPRGEPREARAAVISRRRRRAARWGTEQQCARMRQQRRRWCRCGAAGATGGGIPRRRKQPRRGGRRLT